jgi:hypothetical protein
VPDSTFKALTTERLADARTLHGAGRHSGAYYMAGYAAECALKVCVIKRIADVAARDYMPEKTLLKNIYIHDLNELIKSADLSPQLDSAKRSSATFRVNWATVSKWSEAARYKTWSEQDAADILLALTDASDGVLPWIQNFW